MQHAERLTAALEQAFTAEGLTPSAAREEAATAAAEVQSAANHAHACEILSLAHTVRTLHRSTMRG